eukprot:TRINITY_DN13205_c0_g1_i1.p1 TRINITY_DN13205_c0_g1~~TRINITY_DN13205_c0_g1_i1.p1  ORF type:complete len:154 (-),score=21.01 TRINITY_DN13205_c0_g1_i1:22-483(-)
MKLILVSLLFILLSCRVTGNLTGARLSSHITAWNEVDKDGVIASYAEDAEICINGACSFDPQAKITALFVPVQSLKVTVTNVGKSDTADSYLFTMHVVSLNGCEAQFSGCGINMYNDADKIQKHIVVADQKGWDDWLGCVSEYILGAHAEWQF